MNLSMTKNPPKIPVQGEPPENERGFPTKNPRKKPEMDKTKDPPRPVPKLPSKRNT